MSKESLLRCQNWIMAQGQESRCINMMEFVGPGGFDVESFSRKFGDIPSKGLYAFVWNGELPKDLNLELKLKGKKAPSEPRKSQNQLIEDGHYIHQIRWKLDDFPSECRLGTSPRYPLYIGKTTTFRKRIQQHLHLSIDDWKKPATVHRNGAPKTATCQEGFLHKHSTACQFRSGIEHLLRYPGKDQLLALRHHLDLCFLPNEDVKDRFYLEDLAIGYFRPWFNVDSER